MAEKKLDENKKLMLNFLRNGLIDCKFKSDGQLLLKLTDNGSEFLSKIRLLVD